MREKKKKKEKYIRKGRKLEPLNGVLKKQFQINQIISTDKRQITLQTIVLNPKNIQQNNKNR